MQGKNILIVEDETMLLDVLRDEFVSAGFEVARAQNGEDGLKLALQTKPDIILIDILMPKMDGITMLQQCRQHPELLKVPVIILTNLNDTQTIQKALESGAYDYLVKSDWNPKDLVAHVQEKLRI